MSQDRVVRNLAQLERSGSTARVLNLNAIAKRLAHDAEYQRRPLFRNGLLNRSIVIKHRLRRNEHELFDDYRLQATKVVLPIEPKDLSVGAYYFFVGQKGYAETLDRLMGPLAQVGPHDLTVLQILDKSPTLDPFVLREQLRRHGLEPSPHYFDIGPADLNRMVAFVGQQIAPLAEMTAAPGAAENRGTKLARKLLSSAADRETELLRHTLKLDFDAYCEGVFSWKGFLYYKWCLDELTPHIEEVCADIGRVKLKAPASAQASARVHMARTQLRQSLTAARESITDTIRVYDEAYALLVQRRDPASFRQFLLDAPSLFSKFGEGLGAIQHIVSYWRYRFARRGTASVDAAEFSDILEDFLDALRAFDAQADEMLCTRYERALLV